MSVILVTKKEYGKAVGSCTEFRKENILAAPCDEKSLAEAVRNQSARVVVVGVEPYAGPLYEALEKNGEVGERPSALIARFGVGHDGIDKSLASKHGICVTNTPGTLSRSVAEHTFWLIGSLLRNVVQGDVAMRSGEFPSHCGFELGGKTMLVVGAGEIGRKVARTARFGFDMRVFAVDRYSLQESCNLAKKNEQEYLQENGIEQYGQDVDAFLAEADVVSLHLASTEATRHFISEQRLQRMKRTAVLVNTSRGPVVDERALFQALKTKQIMGAALDVFESEPYSPDGEETDLRTLDNVVLTPHWGSSTFEANKRMAESVLHNIACFFEKRYDDMDIVDRTVFRNT